MTAELLSTLKDVRGVLGAFHASTEAGLFARDVPRVYDDDTLVKAAGRAARILDTLADEPSLDGGLEGVLLRYADAGLFVRPTAAGVLAVLVSPECNLPALRRGAALVARRLPSVAVPPASVATPAASVAAPAAPSTDRAAPVEVAPRRASLPPPPPPPPLPPKVPPALRPTVAGEVPAVQSRGSSTSAMPDATHAELPPPVVPTRAADLPPARRDATGRVSVPGVPGAPTAARPMRWRGSRIDEP